MRHMRVSDRLSAGNILFVLAVILAIFLIKPAESGSFAVSDEARFTDTSPSGLQIVPASGGTVTGSYVCPTAIEGGFDANSNILYAGAVNRQINRAGIYKCVSNYNGNHIFIPGRSAAELQSFINAAPGIGVGVSNP